MKKDIILAGVGGQGILSIATIIGHAALRLNMFLKQAEVHGMSQRGGDVMSCLRLSTEPIASDLIPKGKVDLIISLEPMEALRYIDQLAPDGHVITSTEPFVNIPTYPEIGTVLQELEAHGNCVMLPCEGIAKQVATARSSNMVLLGAAAPMLGLTVDDLTQSIKTIFGPKGDKIVDSNIAALKAGLDYETRN